MNIDPGTELMQRRNIIPHKHPGHVCMEHIRPVIDSLANFNAMFRITFVIACSFLTLPSITSSAVWAAPESPTASSAHDDKDNMFIRYGAGKWESRAFSLGHQLQNSRTGNRAAGGDAPEVILFASLPQFSIKSVEIGYSFGGKYSRGTLIYGFAGSEAPGTTGITRNKSQKTLVGTSTITTTVDENRVDINNSGSIARYRIGYDHEFYILHKSSRWLKRFALLLGADLIYDRLKYSGSLQLAEGSTTVSINGTPSVFPAGGVGPIKNRRTIENGDGELTLRAGIVYRSPITASFDFDLRALVLYGRADAKLKLSGKSVTSIPFGSSNLILPGNIKDEVGYKGKVQGMEIGFGLRYFFNDRMAIRLGMESRSTNLTISETKSKQSNNSGSGFNIALLAGGTLDPQVIAAGQLPDIGPRPEARDRMSRFILEFQYRL